MIRMVVLMCLLALAGCSRDIGSIGTVPELTPLQPYSTYPYGLGSKVAEGNERLSSNSLWRDRRASLFRDRPPVAPGDLVTILVDVDDQAALDNRSQRSRSSGAGLGINGSAAIGSFEGAGGLEFDAEGRSSNQGEGRIARSERVNLRVAAIVHNVWPNGTLFVIGHQEIRVNNEVRVLTIEGLIRAEDILSDNTIAYDRVAEARVSYGGRGRMSEVQNPQAPHQLYDAIAPF